MRTCVWLKPLLNTQKHDACIWTGNEHNPLPHQKHLLQPLKAQRFPQTCSLLWPEHLPKLIHISVLRYTIFSSVFSLWLLQHSCFSWHLNTKIPSELLFPLLALLYQTCLLRYQRNVSSHPVSGCWGFVFSLNCLQLASCSAIAQEQCG